MTGLLEGKRILVTGIITDSLLYLLERKGVHRRDVKLAFNRHDSFAERLGDCHCDILVERTSGCFCLAVTIKYSD